MAQSQQATLNLKIAIDVIDNASAAINNLAANLNNLRNAIHNVNVKLPQANANFNAFRRNVLDLSMALREAALVVMLFGGALLGIGGGIAKAGLGMEELRQRTTAAFANLLQSAEKARALYADLQTFAVKSPFNMEETVKLSQRLLAMGFDAKDLLNTLTAIANAAGVAGGGTDRFVRIGDAVGKMLAEGKVHMRRINQLAAANLNVWPVLEKGFGKTRAQLIAMMRSAKGLASKPVVDLLLRTWEGDPTTAFGKQYASMMDAMIQFISGRIEQIRDSISNLLGDLLAPLYQWVVTILRWVAEFLGRVWDLWQALKKAHPTIAKVIAILFSLQVAGTIVFGALIVAVGGVLVALSSVAFFLGVLFTSLSALQTLTAPGAIAALFAQIPPLITAIWGAVRGMVTMRGVLLLLPRAFWFLTKAIWGAIWALVRWIVVKIAAFWEIAVIAAAILALAYAFGLLGKHGEGTTGRLGRMGAAVARVADSIRRLWNGVRSVRNDIKFLGATLLIATAAAVLGQYQVAAFVAVAGVLIYALTRLYIAYLRALGAAMEWASGLRNSVASGLRAILDEITGFFPRMYHSGRELFRQFVRGMSVEHSPLGRVLKRILTWIDEHLPHSPAKRGPLKTLDETGPGLIGTLARGIRKSVGVARKAAVSVGAAITSGMRPHPKALTVTPDIPRLPAPKLPAPKWKIERPPDSGGSEPWLPRLPMRKVPVAPGVTGIRPMPHVPARPLTSRPPGVWPPVILVGGPLTSGRPGSLPAGAPLTGGTPPSVLPRIPWPKLPVGPSLITPSPRARVRIRPAPEPRVTIRPLPEAPPCGTTLYPIPNLPDPTSGVASTGGSRLAVNGRSIGNGTVSAEQVAENEWVIRIRTDKTSEMLRSSYHRARQQVGF